MYGESRYSSEVWARCEDVWDEYYDQGSVRYGDGE